MKNLKSIFEKYGINLEDRQIKQFEMYFEHLIKTNEKMNLTAITEENEVLIKHFLDSCLPVNEFERNKSVIDVGSGAGFPSIPLKIVRPDLEICMIDSLNKRINFLNETIELLKLNKISATHFRAEDFAKENREMFDYAVARAVAPLNTLVEYLLPFVKVGGKAIVYKSQKLEEELVLSKNAIRTLGGEIEEVKTFFIEEGELERNVLIIKKTKPTPTKYPRDKNRPKTNPIQ